MATEAERNIVIRNTIYYKKNININKTSKIDT